MINKYLPNIHSETRDVLRAWRSVWSVDPERQSSYSYSLCYVLVGNSQLFQIG